MYICKGTTIFEEPIESYFYTKMKPNNKKTTHFFQLLFVVLATLTLTHTTTALWRYRPTATQEVGLDDAAVGYPVNRMIGRNYHHHGHQQNVYGTLRQHVPHHHQTGFMLPHDGGFNTGIQYKGFNTGYKGLNTGYKGLHSLSAKGVYGPTQADFPVVDGGLQRKFVDGIHGPLLNGKQNYGMKRRDSWYRRSIKTNIF